MADHRASRRSGTGYIVVCVSSLPPIPAGRLHLVGLFWTRKEQQEEEAVQVVVRCVWRPVLLEETEQGLGHTGQYGPPRSRGLPSACSHHMVQLMVCGVRRPVQLEGPKRSPGTAEKQVFRAHAAPQGVCDNLINALKLLANQQTYGDGPVKMVVPGLLEKKSAQNNGQAQKFYGSYQSIMQQ